MSKETGRFSSVIYLSEFILDNRAWADANEIRDAEQPRHHAMSEGTPKIKRAKFSVGQVVRHRFYPFRGVVFDIDPEFANTEEWWESIPSDIRPSKNQPFYHLLAENDETEYIAYVSEQNLLPDESGNPLRHPQISELFVEDDDGHLRAVFLQEH